MDEVEKCRVRLAHWIDHNMDHLKGYVEVAQVLETRGHEDSALQVREGIRLVKSANAKFQEALKGVSSEIEEPVSEDHVETRSHAHTHEHTHAHSHEHAHEHCNTSAQCHSHDNDHKY